MVFQGQIHLSAEKANEQGQQTRKEKNENEEIKKTLFLCKIIEEGQMQLKKVIDEGKRKFCV